MEPGRNLFPYEHRNYLLDVRAVVVMAQVYQDAYVSPRLFCQYERSAPVRYRGAVSSRLENLVFD
jgi:hypothetical protein